LSKAGFRSQLVKVIAGLCVLAIGQSLLRWHDSYSGFYSELGKSSTDVKRKVQVKEYSQDRIAKLARMSDDAIVAMKLL